MIQVYLPGHLRTLAGVGMYVEMEVSPPVTPSTILDALEARYPVLRGTIRDHDSGQRRPYLRFYACDDDFSLEPLDKPVPHAVAEGTEPFIILGAIAGG